MQTRLIILLLCAILIIMFAVVNTEPVKVDFLFFDTQIKLIYVIIFSFLLGALSMYTISTLSHIKQKKNKINSEKNKDKLDKKIDEQINKELHSAEIEKEASKTEDVENKINI